MEGARVAGAGGRGVDLVEGVCGRYACVQCKEVGLFEISEFANFTLYSTLVASGLASSAKGGAGYLRSSSAYFTTR